jgi:hypothetical protein
MKLPNRQQWQQIEPCLDELLDLDPAARRGRLAQLRCEDGALAHELEALLLGLDALRGEPFAAVGGPAPRAAPFAGGAAAAGDVRGEKRSGGFHS